MKIERCYIDLDNTLTDFSGTFIKLYGIDPFDYEKQFGKVRFWEKLWEKPTIFRDLEPMPHAQALFNMASNIAPVTILSAPSKTNQALCLSDKRTWIDFHFGKNVPAIFEKDKHIYAGPNRVLIDDWESKVDKWRANGGIAHQFKDWEGCKLFLKDLANVG